MTWENKELFNKKEILLLNNLTAKSDKLIKVKVKKLVIKLNNKDISISINFILYIVLKIIKSSKYY